jgi:hypothetical protein
MEIELEEQLAFSSIAMSSPAKVQINAIKKRECKSARELYISNL